jgi:hypothetical protein
MKLSYVFTAGLLFCLTTPALADFYVVQDTGTKKCTVVTEKPKTTSSVTVLGTTVFKTQSDADAYVKKTKVCTSE